MPRFLNNESGNKKERFSSLKVDENEGKIITQESNKKNWMRKTECWISPSKSCKSLRFWVKRLSGSSLLSKTRVDNRVHVFRIKMRDFGTEIGSSSELKLQSKSSRAES